MKTFREIIQYKTFFRSEITHYSRTHDTETKTSPLSSVNSYLLYIITKDESKPKSIIKLIGFGDIEVDNNDKQY